MNLRSISFKISSQEILNSKEEKLALNLYHPLFTKIYGYDFYDAYLEVIKSKNYLEPQDNVLGMAPNSLKLKEVLDDIENNPHIEVLKVFKNYKLIGLGRIEIQKRKIRLKELVLKIKDKEKIKLIWEKALEFIISYYQDDYEKLLVEIPLKEPFLLLLLDKLGFKENPQDINIGDKTYILSKEIGYDNE